MARSKPTDSVLPNVSSLSSVSAEKEAEAVAAGTAPGSRAARQFSDAARSNVTEALKCVSKRDIAGVVRLSATWGIPMTDAEARQVIEAYTRMSREDMDRLRSVFDNTAMS